MGELDLSEFDYELPAASIAQQPTARREDARLLVLSRAGEPSRHGHVRELGRFLRAGDLLVVNATRVVPARLRGAKRTGGRARRPADRARARASRLVNSAARAP